MTIQYQQYIIISTIQYNINKCKGARKEKSNLYRNEFMWTAHQVLTFTNSGKLATRYIFDKCDVLHIQLLACCCCCCCCCYWIYRQYYLGKYSESIDCFLKTSITYTQIYTLKYILKYSNTQILKVSVCSNSCWVYFPCKMNYDVPVSEA